MTTFDAFFARLTLPRALGLTALLWAGIYLPVLGSLEIKGEEGRRILPAVAMLDSGDWIVPQVGGVPYYSKPPLINWVIAKSFQWTGTRSEWAARLPSVFAALALALTAVWSLSRWLGPGGALLCAVFLLTNIGLMEKGRLAEIESVYLSLYGVALLLWLGAWRRDADDKAAARPRFPWRAWTLPFGFLGLGLLTKGPLHVVYFYASVLGILGFTRRWRDLFNWAHGLGILLMLAIFAAWAVPYLHEMNAGHVAGRWYAQMAGRAEVGDRFRLGAWLLNGPRGLANFLPWVVLLPLAWRMRPDATALRGSPVDGDLRAPSFDVAVARGLCWALAVPFVLVSLAPGGIPRYTLPLIVPASVLLALTFARRLPGRPGGLPLVWSRVMAGCLWLAILTAPAAVFLGGKGTWRCLIALVVVTVGVYLLRRLGRLRRFAEEVEPFSPRAIPRTLPLALASGVVMALFTANYAVGAVHRLHRNETVRPVGAAIRRAVPAGQKLAVLQPGFLPFLFYVDRLLYLQSPHALPPAVHYLLVRETDFAATEASLKAQGLDSRILIRARDKRIADGPRATWLLLGLDRAGMPSL